MPESWSAASVVSDGKARPDRLAVTPCRGKLDVRHVREGDGNVGIIRSSVRAIALPELSTTGDTLRGEDVTVAMRVVLTYTDSRPRQRRSIGASSVSSTPGIESRTTGSWIPKPR